VPIYLNRKGAAIVPHTFASARVDRAVASSAVSPVGDRAASTGSWSLPVRDGAYGPIPAWTSGNAWFDELMDVLATAAGEELRRRARVARDTLLQIARADWLSADAGTGRGVTTAHETVAVMLGMSSKTVQRGRRLMEALGFAVTVAEGRYLTVAEREAAHELHGGRQVRAASVRALTMPKPAAVENVHLPRRGPSLKKPPFKRSSLRRASAKLEVATRPRHQRGRGFVRKTHDEGPRSLAAQQLAGRLVARMPWLSRERHIGHVCSMIDRAGIDPAGWTVDGLLRRIEDRNRALGQTVLDPAVQRDPLAYFGWLLRRSIDPAEPSEREMIQLREEARAIERVERMAARDAWLAQAAADRAAAASPETEAARAAYFAQFPPSRRRT
jgi:hypothetical protein